MVVISPKISLNDRKRKVPNPKPPEQEVQQAQNETYIESVNK